MQFQEIGVEVQFPIFLRNILRGPTQYSRLHKILVINRNINTKNK